MLTPMIGREISSLTFYFSTAPTAAWTANLDVKIGTTTIANLSSSFAPEPSNLVFDASLSTTVSGNVMVINFTTPFTYTGDNLLIQFHTTGQITYPRGYFYGISQTGGGRYSYNGSSGTSQTFLPKVKLELVP
jgi:hypothetical protein